MHGELDRTIHLPARRFDRDAHWLELASPEELAFRSPFNLYRFYDLDRKPLYIGIAQCLRVRWYAHQTKAPWWSSVGYVAVSMYTFADWERAIEFAAIQAERPPFNTFGNRRSSLRTDPGLAPPPPEFPWH